MSTESYSIEYIINEDEENIYFGLCDKIKISDLSKNKIYLDLEKILAKNKVRDIQGLRLKQTDLLKEIDNLNKINRILIILIIVIILVNIGGIINPFNKKVE
jgi:hypothetical protein